MSYRGNVKSRLEQHVQTLDQLNSALHLLEELRDMENKIDGIYLPIETMYSKLRYGQDASVYMISDSAYLIDIPNSSSDTVTELPTYL